LFTKQIDIASLNCGADEIPATPSRFFESSKASASDKTTPFADPGHRIGKAAQTGVLIINADDWGRDRENTERIRECALRKTISSVSAMVYMEDSERAAALAQESGIDAGLHLNFTTPFSAPNCPATLAERQREIAAYLWRHRFARVVYHPGLSRAFEYVFAAQLDEFNRLYQRPPNRFDGHHHMHLCANVVLGKVLPHGTVVRPSFSFLVGEKSLMNIFYRRILNRLLARRHQMVDYFFGLAPLEPQSRLQRIFALSRRFSVEMETHPVVPAEYRFLTSEKILAFIEGLQIAPRYELSGVRPD
jgi:chitin disaccharide deacetylase